MPIPFIIGGLALAAAGAGIKKGIDANSKNSDAKEIVEDAQERFEDAQERLEEERVKLNNELKEFATLKLSVFTTEINTLVSLVKKCKDANSVLDSENINFTAEEIKELESSVSSSLEISAGLGKGVASGALTAMGAYGSVGMLATASTGTAIGGLSGVAATNATLAWLGGGSLAAGGGGMALGTAVLGGMVAGPLIAITGFVMDSKAEQNLTEAYEYESEIDIGIEKIDYSIEEYNSIYKYIDELSIIIHKFRDEFNSVYKNLNNISLKSKAKRFFGVTKVCEEKAFEQLMVIGKNLKIVLDIPLMDKDGNKNKNFTNEIKRITV
jgi:hypothetical protein